MREMNINFTRDELDKIKWFFLFLKISGVNLSSFKMVTWEIKVQEGSMVFLWLLVLIGTSIVVILVGDE